MLPEFVENKLKKEAKERKLKDSELKAVEKAVESAYNRAGIEPGEAIGVITAESFGEPATQMTLDVFHFAGVAEMQVTRGLPRLIEIFDARKEPSTPRMELPVRPKYAKSIEAIKELTLVIKETKIKEVCSEIKVNVAKKQIEVVLDKKETRARGIKPKEVSKAIEDGIKALKLKEGEDELILKSADKESTLSDLYKQKEKIREIVIKGVKGITHVLPVKEEEEYTIHCAGSNLKDALKLEEFDKERIRSNNIFEIAEVLGIEAARQAIIDEAIKVIEEQGLDIDIRHIMLLADVMTTTGIIKGITRTGVTGSKESVFARASFETPIKHLVNASLTGERDDIKSVIENVLVNQPIPVGTGLPKLVMKEKKNDK